MCEGWFCRRLSALLPIYLPILNSSFPAPLPHTTPTPKTTKHEQRQALFEAVGLKGKPAHKAPQETPYPVERLFEDSASAASEGVVVTRTKAAQAQAAM